MNNNFDPENAVAVNETSQGTTPTDTGNFNVDNAIPVTTSKDGTTPYESFSRETPKSQITDQELENRGEGDYAAMRRADKAPTMAQGIEEVPQGAKSPQKPPQGPPGPQKGPLKGVSKYGKPYTEVIGPERPDEGLFNSFVSQAFEAPSWRMIAKPLLGKKGYEKVGGQDVDDYLADMEKKHPIASTIAGTSSFIAAAALYPESLLPNIWTRTAVQFGLVGGLNSLGEAVTHPAKSFEEDINKVAGDTLKNMAFSPIYAAVHKIEIINRPFLNALVKAGVPLEEATKKAAQPFLSAFTRAGVITSGNTVMSMMFGDNITQAFKQSGILGVLSLLTESPHLAKTVIGQGVINHVNTIRAEQMVKGGLPDQAKPVQNIETAQAAKIERTPGTVIDHGNGLKSVVLTPVQIKKLGQLVEVEGQTSDGHSLIQAWKASISDFNAEKAGIKDTDKVIIINSEGKENIDEVIQHEKSHHEFASFTDEEKSVFKNNADKIINDKEHPLQEEIKDLRKDYAENKIAEELYVRGFIDKNGNVIKGTKKGQIAIPMDPDSPDFVEQVHVAINDLSKQVPGLDKPQIIAATIRKQDDKGQFSDESPAIHATNHDDALGKIGAKKKEVVIKTKKPPGKTQKPRTLGGLIKNFGYMDFTKMPEVPNEDKKGLWLYHRKGAQSPDSLAQEMVSAHLLPEGTTGDKLLYLLRREGDKILGEIQAKEADYEKEYEAWKAKEEKEAANDKITKSEIERIEADLEKESRRKSPEELLNWSEEPQGPEHTPSGQLRHELQSPIPGDLFQEKGELFEEGKDYEVGFTVLNPDGSIHFITREESQKEPFNLPNGHSEDVKGLNESKFTTPAEEPKIVNPETLKKIANNEGKVDANMYPFAAEIAENLEKAKKNLAEAFVPSDISEPSKFAQMTMRQLLGLRAKYEDQLADALRAAHTMFEKARKEDIINQYTRAERGEAQDTPALQKIYDFGQKMLHDKALEVQQKTGKLKECIQNYLPHMWEDPKRAQKLLGAIMGRRPFRGPMGFLKHRTIDDFEAGIKAGLNPISWNPIDIWMYKIKEMDKFILAHDAMMAGKENKMVTYVPVSGKSPEDWVKINDSISTVFKSPMIPVTEYYDDAVMNGLNKVAESLGITVERKGSIGGKRLGYAVKGPALPGGGYGPGSIVNKFGTPEDVMAHELGHQIDWIHGIKEAMFGGSRPKADFILDKMIGKAEREGRMDDVKRMQDQKVINKELRDLGDATEGPEYWRRKSEEKMAIMLGSLIHAPEDFKKYAPTAYKMFTDIIKSDPQLKPLMDIKPSLKLHEPHGGEVYAGGNVISGYYYTHPDFARIINNYLSPGLRGNYFYDLYRTAGNTLIQARLSLSAFHFTFVSNDANIGNFSLGLSKLQAGDKAGAFKTALMSFLGPLGPIKTIMEGRKVNEAWYGHSNDPDALRIADLYARAGARAKMDRYYAIEADKAMSKAIKDGKYMTGILHTPFWILQQVMRPLMEYYVPRMKMGVFAQMLKSELQLKPDMSQQELLMKANKAVDAVDDRMGQLVYDNLFIDRTLKDVGMASVQSLGWNIGDVRLFGGSIADIIKNLNDLRQGKQIPSEAMYRINYVIAMPIVMGFYGAVYQYLHTGKKPGEGIEDQGIGGIMKDLYFPRNGGIDPRGQESRVSLPSYVKDVYHFAEDPAQTVLNKLNPLNNETISMLQNKDFYNVKIHNEDDPLMQQVGDNLSYGVQSNLPYSIQSAQRTPQGTLGGKIESFFGINVAPYDLNMTSAEKLAHQQSMGNIPVGSRTKAKAEHSKAKGKVASDYMANHDKSVLTQAVSDGIISNKEKNMIIKESTQTNLQRLTKNLTFEQVFHILNKGKPNDSEKAELEKILEKKKSNEKEHGKWTSEEEELYDRSLAIAQ